MIEPMDNRMASDILENGPEHIMTEDWYEAINIAVDTLRNPGKYERFFEQLMLMFRGGFDVEFWQDGGTDRIKIVIRKYGFKYSRTVWLSQTNTDDVDNMIFMLKQMQRDFYIGLQDSKRNNEDI